MLTVEGSFMSGHCERFAELPRKCQENNVEGKDYFTDVFRGPSHSHLGLLILDMCDTR